jgi:ATP adenylyltransferase
MPKNGGCLFCDIQKEEDDDRAGILKRGRNWFVILNMFPYTSGHVMIVAARHIERLTEMTGDEVAELGELLVLCEQAVDEAYNPDGMNIGMNRGGSAGAGIVGHLHFHLCPRWEGDSNFMTAIAETRVVSEELEETYTRLKPHFNREG